MASGSGGDGASGSRQQPEGSSHQKRVRENGADERVSSSFRVPKRDRSLLSATHSSEGVRDASHTSKVVIRRGGGKTVVCRHPDILRAIHRAGFYGASFISQFNVDHHLISALVERWQPETHTFHLSVGEATITLQDIEIISGLPVDGLPVSGIVGPPYSNDDPEVRLKWPDVVEKLLGFRPADSDIEGNKIKLTSIKAHFTREIRQLPMHIEDQLLVDRLARCYIMILIGGGLLNETTGHGFNLCYLTLIEDLEVAGTYSWGSAVLANLYKDMSKVASGKTKGLAGGLHIIQIWAYLRLLCNRPTRRTGPPVFESPEGLPPPPVGYSWTGRGTTNVDLPGHSIVLARDQLDRQTNDQMVWEPYKMNEIDPYYIRGRHTTWMAKVPMHKYSIVKWHYPDRVLRQFGRWQHCPIDLPSGTTVLHSMIRSKTHKDWSINFAHLISLWERRVDHLIQAEPFDLACWGTYMTWYKSVTHIIIQPSRVGSHTSHYEPSAHIISALGKSMLALTKYVGSQRRRNPEAITLYTESVETLRNHGFEVSSDSDSDIVDEEVDIVQDAPAQMSQDRLSLVQQQDELLTQQIQSRHSRVFDRLFMSTVGYDETSEHCQSSECGVMPGSSREPGHSGGPTFGCVSNYCRASEFIYPDRYGEEARFYRSLSFGGVSNYGEEIRYKTGARYDGPTGADGLSRYYQNSIFTGLPHCTCRPKQPHCAASPGHITHDPYFHTPLVQHGFDYNSRQNGHRDTHVEERKTCAIVLTPGYGEYIPYIAPTDKIDDDF